MALTNKRKVFVYEYVKCWNATEAARRAGYKQPNTQGPRLLVNDGVKARIKEVLDDAAMSSEECLQLLSDIARGDQPAHPSQLKALELVGKAHAMFIDRSKTEVDLGAPHPAFVEVKPPGENDNGN
jgi:phage terminase small subunit